MKPQRTRSCNEVDFKGVLRNFRSLTQPFDRLLGDFSVKIPLFSFQLLTSSDIQYKDSDIPSVSFEDLTSNFHRKPQIYRDHYRLTGCPVVRVSKRYIFNTRDITSRDITSIVQQVEVVRLEVLFPLKTRISMIHSFRPLFTFINFLRSVYDLFKSQVR